MLEVIFFVADPMVHKPLLPTNDLFCAAVEDGATGRVQPPKSREQTQDRTIPQCY
jgi:hypothetical protein